MAEANRQAAFLIIGNEILSGRTQDTNLRTLAQALRSRGVLLAEARTVRDEQPAIVAALNELRAKYDYLFTSGGIGPTHDDITTACVACAFGRPVVRHPAAEAELRAYYEANGRAATAARLRMADVPEGADLIECGATAAPGYTLANVFVFAGVPHIFAEMAQAALPRLAAGPQLHARAIMIGIGESEVADDLGGVQQRYAQLELGSYPKIRAGKHVSELVVSGADAKLVEQAMAELTGLLDRRGVPWRPS